MADQANGSNMPITPKSQASAWDGGWYLFEEGQVKGPLSAKEAFASSDEKLPGLLVSRKGFSQWYPVGDFVSIYKMAEKFSDALGPVPNVASEKSVPIVRGNSVKDSYPQTRNQQSSSKFAETIIQSAQSELTVDSLFVQDSANLVSGVQSKDATDSEEQPVETPEIKKLTRKEKKRLIEEERRRRKYAARQVALAKKASNNQAEYPPITFEQQYFEVAGRLRLGKISSPILAAFVYTPLSFGGYWWAWFERVSEEVGWHLNGASRMNFILPVWMCLIPGPHLLLAYLVARMVRQIEEQNGYRSVNPAVATLLAIFPPLYVFKIQSALNRHWRLHVFHSVKR
jgi:hypothetical protein